MTVLYLCFVTYIHTQYCCKQHLIYLLLVRIPVSFIYFCICFLSVFFHKHLCCVYNNVIKWAYLTAWHLYISNRQSERLSKRANTKGCFSIVHMYQIYWYLDHHSFFLAASIYQYKVFFFSKMNYPWMCVCVSCYSSTCLNLWVKLRCSLYDWERENDL